MHEPDWESGRWLYFTKAKSLHIFHNYTKSRRNSLDDLTSLQRSGCPKPHPGRDGTIVPLPQKEDYEENESKRTHWFWRERLRLGKAWGNQNIRRTSQGGPSPNPGRLDGDPDRERCFWLPDDVEAGSFKSVSIAASDVEMGSPRFRRWSFDEKDVAYPDHGSPTRRYPFLTGRHWEAYPERANHPTESGVYIPRTDSRSTSPSYRKSSVVYVPSRSPGPRRSRPSSTVGTTFDGGAATPHSSISPSRGSHHSAQSFTWVIKLVDIVKTVACVFNSLFLCAPFSALSRKIRLDHATRSRSKQFPRRASHLRKYPFTQPVKFRYSSGSSRRRACCRECDRDFDIYDRRRRWMELTAEHPDNRFPESMEAKYVFTPKYTVDALFSLIRPWVDGKEWWKKVKAFGRYEIKPGLRGDNNDADEDDKRGRRRSGDGGERRWVREGRKDEERRR